MVDFYIVLDFEATCEKDIRIRAPEIIEFPLVVIDAREKRIIDEIQIYVKPLIRPILTPFCVELTGISQETVDGATDFPRAMKQIMSFLDKYSNFAFVTCGNWDLETMLPIQAAHSRIKIHDCFSRWINVKAEYQRCYNERARGMLFMLNRLGITLIGRHHSGIDDCRNIAKIVIHMLRANFKLKQTNKLK